MLDDKIIDVAMKLVMQNNPLLHIQSCNRILEYSLFNSCRHSANADVIADMKSKTTVTCWHFFGDMIFSATS